MSFAALRASARRATASTARVSPRVAVRNAAVRRYATEGAPPPPPKSSSNAALFGALGAAVFAGGAFYVFSSSDSAAEASSKSSINTANYVPTKEDYQKVSVAVFLSYVRCRFSTLCSAAGWYRNGCADCAPPQVYNRVAEIFDQAADKNYDGACVALLLPSRRPGRRERRTHTPGILGFLSVQMARTAPFSSVSPGTRRARTTKRPKLAAGTALSRRSSGLFASADTCSHPPSTFHALSNASGNTRHVLSCTMM